MEFLKEELARFENMILDVTRSEVGTVERIVKYIFDGKGKRIRPALVLLTSRALGYDGPRSLSYAMVVELIHTATLLHDDVLDNAKVRRGKPSVNRLFGNQTSVLLGDFLYSKAVEIMGLDGDSELIRIVSRATTEVAEGEILEITKTGDLELSESEYFEIISKKTASLFRASCEIGAELAKSGEKLRGILKSFGEMLGLSFQIVDDILDYISEGRILGKKIGTDLREKKVTLPLIKALERADIKRREFLEEVFRKPRISKVDFASVKSFIEDMGGFEYAKLRARELVDNAKRNLDYLPDTAFRDALIRIAEETISRKS